MARTKKVKKGTKKSTVRFINKISTNLILAILLFIWGSQTITTLIAGNFAKNRLLDLSSNNLQSVAIEKSVALLQFMEDQKTICQLLQSDPNINNQASVFAVSGSINAKSQAQAVETLKSVYDNTGKVYEKVFITFGSQVFANNEGNSKLEDVSEETYYQECVKNGSYFSNAISSETGRPIYIISYAITSKSGNVLGTANIFVDMGKVGNQVISSEEFSICVLTHEGIIVSSNGSEEELGTSVGDVSMMLAADHGTSVVDLSQWGKSKSYLAYKLTDDFIVQVAEDYETIIAGSKEMKQNLNFVSAFLSIIVISILLILIRVIIKPLNKASKDIEEVIASIESGRGDLTKRLTNKRKDEISVLVKGINKLMDSMAGIISNVQTTTGVVTGTSSAISEQVSRAEVEVSNVSSTMEEMSASSEETSASMEQVMEQIATVAGLVDDVSTQSMEQAKYAGETVNKVKAIQEKTLAQKEEAQAHLDEVSERLRVRIENAKHVKEISNLTEEILAITSKTNLLSLNASIEAARAGDAGLGFAVVADEIRQLADSSKEAANRIQEVTKNVINDVEALASEAESVTEYMQVSTEKNLADSDFLAESYSNDIKQLAESMAAFQENSKEIQASMDTIKDAIDAVNIAAEETAKGISNVAASTVELSNELQAVVAKSGENLTEANVLSEEINKFIIE